MCSVARGKLSTRSMRSSVEVAQEGLDEGRRELLERDAGLVRALDGLVVDVGEVHHLGDAVAEVAQGPPQQVLEQEGAEVADVDVVVDRGSAGVDAHLAGNGGAEGLQPPAQGVEQDELVGRGHFAGF